MEELFPYDIQCQSKRRRQRRLIIRGREGGKKVVDFAFLLDVIWLLMKKLLFLDFSWTRTRPGLAQSRGWRFPYKRSLVQLTDTGAVFMYP